MKLENNFLKNLRAWPEEGRVGLAVILFLISALAVFALWRTDLSRRLASFSTGEPSVAETTRNHPKTYYNETPAALGPLVGIGETLLSVGTIFPEIFPLQENFSEGVWQTFYDIGKIIDNLIKTLRWPK